jgi:hypothetical protein
VSTVSRGRTCAAEAHTLGQAFDGTTIRTRSHHGNKGPWIPGSTLERGPHRGMRAQSTAE